MNRREADGPTDAEKGGRPPRLVTAHGEVALPAFFPDATRGVVRAVGSDDLERCGVQGVVVNAFHLARSPGAGLIKSQGGIHAFMGWARPVVADSGGFQAMSMVRENARYGTVSDAGITFTDPDAPRRKRLRLTPEKCIQIQFDLGADVMMCLDDCPRPDADERQVAESVRRTIAWAGRCRREFERQLAVRHLDRRPLLFGIIHGGRSPRWRSECASALLEMGFDGYGFGGWPLDAEGRLDVETLAYTAQLVPADRPLFALGVGGPDEIARCVQMGYRLFDCVLPTRDARHRRLYAFAAGDDPFAWSFIYIHDDRYRRDSRPISEGCGCPCCRRYSRSYLHHLFRVQDGLAWRLATVHNLYFYATWMERLRERATHSR